MNSYTLSLLVQDDLQEIWHHIAKDNPSAADKVEAKLYEAFALLAENPHIGQRRTDLTNKPIRFWPVYTYQILYDPKTNPLLILRILSGYRDIHSLME